MDISQNCLALTKKWEEFRADAYLDPVGIPTIGYGTIRYPNRQKVQMGDVISEPEAEDLMKLECDEFAEVVNKAVTTTPNQNQFDALVCFCYNVNYRIQIQAFFDKSELRPILEALTNVLTPSITVEDFAGNVLLGQPSETSSPEYPVMAQEEMIGRVRGEKPAQIFAQLLTYLANQELLVIFDDLTGIANRRYFDRYSSQEWRRSRREASPLSLLICDLDFFKAYNDYYGHQAGDDCLRQVAEVLSQTLKRPADWVARYGGEELAVILPNTDSRGAETVAEELCLAVRELKIPHHLSEVSPQVTISIGISTLVPTQETVLENLIMAADLALYRAKATGRNCYC
jgi:diguanylate cyclase (GGDEF)-like protein